MTRKEQILAKIAELEVELERTPDDAPAEPEKQDFSGFIAHLKKKGMLEHNEIETHEEALRRVIAGRL